MNLLFPPQLRPLLMAGLLLPAANVCVYGNGRPTSSPPPRRCSPPVEVPASVARPLAPASIITVSATLTSSQQVPPNSSTATGTFSGSVDTGTRVLTYTVTYAGLRPTDAHLHRGTPGRNGPLLVPFIGAASSPIIGTITLRQRDLDSLLAGKTYVNLHTAAFPGGEIRGNVSASPTGTTPDASHSALTFQPNPAHELVRFSNVATGAAPIRLLDELGRVVRTVVPQPDGTATLDVRGLPAGVYVVRGENGVQRLVVE